MGVYCCDCETTGLLDDMLKQDKPLLHNFRGIEEITGEIVMFSRSMNNLDKLQEWLDLGHSLVIHNGIRFDSEALKYLGYSTSNNKIIDTLSLSWYLHPKDKVHGLGMWGNRLGFSKPPIEDWNKLTAEEYDVRVTGDCLIQLAVWKLFKRELSELYSTKKAKEHLINYLNWKMEMQRIQSVYKWKLNIPSCKKLQTKLEIDIVYRTKELAKVMPKVKMMVWKERPSKPFKKDGSLSVTGTKWKVLCDKLNIDFDSTEKYRVDSGQTEDPNPASHAQVKDWLYSLGWVPQTFKYITNKETREIKKIPQINALKGVCKSILKVKNKHPNKGVENIIGLGMLNNRNNIIKGFLRNVDSKGFISAECSSFTNTLRVKHSILVNLPSGRVPYGIEIRGLLTVPKGYVNIGADLSSLEDRCKHHFQWKYDPEYVKLQMAEGYDPHLQLCLMGGLLTEKQIENHKKGIEKQDDIRHLGKGGNYACQYGAGIPTLARQLGIPTITASKVFNGYWKLNKSVKTIAKNTTVKQANGLVWQYNPISKIWYWLKADKDRFSTLCQGLGAYIFDMWCYGINKECLRRFNKCAPMCAQFHDETILIAKEGSDKMFEKMLKDVIHKLGNKLNLNREMDCGVQYGSNYSEIH